MWLCPSFSRRSRFIVELEEAAIVAGVRFIEIALVIGREARLSAFDERVTIATTQVHRDAQDLLDRTGGRDGLGVMYDNYMRLLETRRAPSGTGDAW